jgi:hypothetical protein
MGLFNKPIFRNFSTVQELTKYFGLEERRKFFETYLQSINLSRGVSGTESFNTYQQNRFSRLEDFTGFSDEKGNPVLKGPYWAKLSKDNENTQAIGEVFENALSNTPALTAAVAQFNNDLAAINTQLKEVPPEIDPRDLPGMLHAIKADAQRAIEEHQAQAKQKLEAQFNDPEFQNKLKAAMNLSDTQLSQVKSDMLAALNQSNSTQLKEFEKSFNNSITDMQCLIQRERDRITYLAAMRKTDDKQFRDAINQLAQKNKHPSLTGVTLTGNPKTGDMSLRGVRVEDLSVLKTITGRDIYMKKDPLHPNDPTKNIYEMELPGWGFGYYNSRHQKVDYDLQSLAEAVRACGHEKITMGVDYNGAEDAEEYGRRMYEACINAGFDPKNITIKVNGEERKLEKTSKDGKEVPGLFTGLHLRLKAAHETAEKLQVERENLAKQPTGSDLPSYKAKLQELRARPAPAPAPAPNPNPGGGPAP